MTKSPEELSNNALNYPTKPIILDAQQALNDGTITIDKRGFLLTPNPDQLPSLGRRPIRLTKNHIYSRVPSTLLGLNDDTARAEAGAPYRDEFENEFEKYGRSQEENGHPWGYGKWVYYPRHKDIVQYPPKNMLRLAQIASNANLILDPEKKMSFQEVDKIFQALVPGIIGLSVGSNIGKALMQALRQDSLVAADPKLFKEPNGNRVLGLSYDRIVMSLMEIERAQRQILSKSEDSIGLNAQGLRNKTITFAEQVHGEHPFVDIYAFSKGVTLENLSTFIGGSIIQPALSCVIEVCDKLSIKMAVAMEARKQGKRLYRLSDVGDAVYIDIRPFDTNPEASIAYGVDDDVLFDLLHKFESTSEESDFFNFAKALVGREHLETASEFAMLINGLLPRATSSVPQWGPATMVGGGWLSTMIARTALGRKFHERTIIDINNSSVTTFGDKV